MLNKPGTVLKQPEKWSPPKFQHEFHGKSNFPGNYPLPRLFQGFLLQRVGVSPNCDVRPLPSFVSGLWLSDKNHRQRHQRWWFFSKSGSHPKMSLISDSRIMVVLPLQTNEKNNILIKSSWWITILCPDTWEFHSEVAYLAIVLDPKVKKRVVKSSFVISNAARTPYLLLFSSWLRPRWQTAAVAPCSNGNVAIRPNSTGTIQPSLDATFFA